MTAQTIEATLDSRFSSPGEPAVAWGNAERQLQSASVYWISTIRSTGHPHVVPLIGVWLDGAFYFCTGETEQKARNLERNPRVTITTGSNALSDTLDIVVEGMAAQVSDDARLRRAAEAYVSKYGDGWRLPGLAGVTLFEVTPSTGFGFGRGDGQALPPGGGFSQTRWRFSAGER